MQFSSGTRELFRDASAALMAALATIMAMEAVFAVCGTHFGGARSVYDPDRYFALISNSSFWVAEEGAEQLITTNRDGYRDTDHPLATPENTLRFAVLGDSLTTGFQVPREQTFPAVAERAYNAQRKGGKKAEFMNFGVYAYSLAQELVTLKRDVLKYHPRIVLLEINQCWAVYRSTPKTQWMNPMPYPNYEYENGKLVPDRFTREHPVQWQGISEDRQRWLNRFQIYCLYRVIGKKFEDAYLEKTGVYARSVRHEFDAAVPPENPDLAEAWRVAEGLLLQIRDAAEKASASLVLVIGDMPELTTPSLQERKNFIAGLKTGDGTYAENRFAGFAEAHGIRSIVLSREMKRASDTTGQSLHTGLTSGHWNRLGHEVAGNAIADTLLADDGNSPESGGNRQRCGHRIIGGVCDGDSDGNRSHSLRVALCRGEFYLRSKPFLCSDSRQPLLGE